MSELVVLEGTIEAVLYVGPGDHYAVLRLAVDDPPDTVTVVGNVPQPRQGERIEVEGAWTHHPRYGRQLRVLSYRLLLPATVHGIEEYLASGNVPGIGEELARRLVERFGEDTLRVIDQEPEKLREVPGIGKKRLASIVQAWREQAAVRETLVFFQGFGLTPRLALLIHARYGEDSIGVVRENPYRLSAEVMGIGFKTADEIAQKMGVAPDSPLRAEAGIRHVLAEAERQGHCYLPAGELVASAAELLQIPAERLAEALETNVREERLVREDGTEGEPVYLPPFHAAERVVARRLAILAGTPGPLAGSRFSDERVARTLERGIELSDEQRDAIRLALENKVAIITGGPGVGKTTIVRNLIQFYLDLGHPIALAAPTGRAAKRLTESTGEAASTIHRLLKFVPREGRFEQDQHNPLEVSLVLVDEASMLDLRLAYHLIQAVPADASLVLVGDVDQLPSVGAGNVLADLIGSGKIPTARLRHVFRQENEERSLIVENAHRINQGEFPVSPSAPDSEIHDFYFVRREDPEETAQTVLDLVQNRIPTRFGLDPVDDVQVITPMHRGEVGTQRLNELLQEALNPAGEEFRTPGGRFREGDKVMQTANDYEKEVFNGDIGRIEGIDPQTLVTKVKFDSRTVEYKSNELSALTLSYCVTVHKAQGSEYPAVVMPLLTQHYLLLQRNLLYTGITRGKRLVVLVGDPKALALAIKNDRPQRRYTRLRDRIVREFEGK